MKAAEHNHMFAQIKLKECYRDEVGVRRDEAEQVDWKGAENDVHAQCILGLRYQYDRGVPKDLKKAVEWYSKSADQGYANAQKALRNLNL